NVQRRAIAVHHLDCPWRPVDLHQRTGRVVRQKNLNYDLGRLVHVYNYVTENSFDAYVWQLVLGKAKFIQQLMSGKLTDRTIDDIAMDLNEYMVEAVAMGAATRGCRKSEPSRTRSSAWRPRSTPTTPPSTGCGTPSTAKPCAPNSSRPASPGSPPSSATPPRPAPAAPPATPTSP